MRRAMFLLPLAVLTVSHLCRGEDPPAMPAPLAEHDWLKQFVGQWKVDSKMHVEPGQPPLEASGTQSARMIGGFWLVAEGQAQFMGMPMTSVLTLGFDAQQKKYVGTWIDSMTGHFWVYEGERDTGGKKLTLVTNGPCPKRPGESTQFKEVIEWQDADHYTFTTYVEGDDGQWTVAVTMSYQRVK